MIAVKSRQAPLLLSLIALLAAASCSSDSVAGLEDENGEPRPDAPMPSLEDIFASKAAFEAAGDTVGSATGTAFSGAYQSLFRNSSFSTDCTVEFVRWWDWYIDTGSSDSALARVLEDGYPDMTGNIHVTQNGGVVELPGLGVVDASTLRGPINADGRFAAVAGDYTSERIHLAAAMTGRITSSSLEGDALARLTNLDHPSMPGSCSFTYHVTGSGAGVPCASVELTPSASTLTSFGRAVRLEATVTDAAGNRIFPDLTWASTDPSTAVVMASGTGAYVAPVANGTTSITASCSAVLGSAAVTVDVPTKSLDWQYQADDFVRYSPAITADGTVYATSFHTVHAIQADGQRKWQFSVQDELTGAAVVGADGTIYVTNALWATDDVPGGVLYALDAAGTLQWQFTTLGPIVAPPALALDGTVYIGSLDSTLYALNPDGSKKWEFAAAAEVAHSPAVSPDGTVYVPVWGTLYAVNPDGSQKWASLDCPRSPSSPAVGSDGAVYLGTEDGLCVVNSDGSKRWEFGTGSPVRASPTVDSDGTVYVGTWGLYAIRSDGSMKWFFQQPGEGQWFGSATIGADGTVYAAGISWEPVDANVLYAFDTDGTVEWEYPTSGWEPVDVSLGPDGTVYLGSVSGLSAVIGEGSGLAQAPWPKAGHDLRNTGNAGGD